jgi:hypothetical protein
MNQPFGRIHDILGVCHEGIHGDEVRCLQNRLTLIGWALFLVCGVAWVLQAATNCDWMGLFIGATWIVGCCLFLWDLKIKGS